MTQLFCLFSIITTLHKLLIMNRKVPLQVPGRHMSVLPSPKRQIKETDLWSKNETSQPVIESSSSVSEQEQPRAIVYFAPAPHCKHSEALVQFAHEVNVKLRVYDILKTDPPTWLPGVPAIETDTGAVYCGDAAFDWVLVQSRRNMEARTVFNKAGNTAPVNQQPMAPRRKQHPDIKPRTLESLSQTDNNAEQQEAYGFLQTNAEGTQPVSAKPVAGGSLASVFKESARMEEMAEAAQAQSLQNPTDIFNQMMNARA